MLMNADANKLGSHWEHVAAYPWPEPETMLRSMAHDDDRRQVDAYEPDTMWKFIIHVLADCRGQGSYFYSGIDGYRLTVEKDTEGFCDNPPPPKKVNLDRKPSKRTLKNCDKDAEV